MEELFQPVELLAKVYRSHMGDTVRFWLNWYVNFADYGSITLYIDGEETSVGETWKHLRSLLEGGVTISVRKTGDWGIGQKRKLAEMYELWLVGKIFGVDLPPDGQCGL